MNQEEAQEKTPVIVIVDDDAGVRMLAVEVLSREGFIVKTAQDGSEGLSIIENIKPDMILLDVVMPLMNGYEVCSKVREIPGLAWVPILMVTGDNDDAGIEQAYSSGATDFVTKPVNWTVLIHRMRFMLRANSALTTIKVNEDKEKALLAAIPDSILRVTKEGTVVQFHGTAAAVNNSFGMVRAHIREVLFTDVADSIMAQVKKALTGSSVEVLECEVAGIAEWEIRAVGCSANEALVIIRDITQRKKTEKALKESEERYKLASLASNDGLWDWDISTDKVHYSQRWKTLLGYEESEIGTSIQEWFMRIHPADAKELKRQIDEHLKAFTPHFENEYRMLHADGNYRWMLTRGIALRDKNGKAYRMAGSQADISKRKSAEEQLQRDALYDPLTGLPNRTLFLDRLTQALKHIRRDTSYICAVLFMDLDRFKIVNDSLGHLGGDQLLVRAAARFEECLRPNDTIARLGGDEFVILLDDMEDGANAEKVAARIQEAFSKPFIINDSEVYSSVSIGIAMSTEHYETPEDILQDADITMYRAKALGKARYEIFNPTMRKKAIEVLQLENDLRRAVEMKQFDIHYQPIIDLETQMIVGFESLLRWNHPIRGTIAPSEFIPLAEETALIVPIGEWVLRTACSQMQEWHADGLENIHIAVNISAVQLKLPDFAGTVMKIVGETGIKPEKLNLEITETVMVELNQMILDTLITLRNNGIQISLDDFGVGYSSLSYLRTLPIDVLKIDRSFIENMMGDKEKQKIVETILVLGRNLGISVIAEGIETGEQLVLLKSIGCPSGQGFLFSRPVEADVARALVQEDVCRSVAGQSS
jgi:diguanylate cyclase (GGDEF)-like protein/PAS domain S-box-containing protein